MSFIYDKTSPGKGGMIGTVYCNFIVQYKLHYLFSRDSPEDFLIILLSSTHGHYGPMHA